MVETYLIQQSKPPGFDHFLRYLDFNQLPR